MRFHHVMLNYTLSHRKKQCVTLFIISLSNCDRLLKCFQWKVLEKKSPFLKDFQGFGVTQSQQCKNSVPTICTRLLSVTDQTNDTAESWSWLNRNTKQHHIISLHDILSLCLEMKKPLAKFSCYQSVFIPHISATVNTFKRTVRNSHVQLITCIYTAQCNTSIWNCKLNNTNVINISTIIIC